jgi:histone H2A
VKVFKELEGLLPDFLRSRFVQMRAEVYRFLSIAYEKALVDEYCRLFEYFLEFLELHVDEVAMAYIMEILVGIFNYLPLKDFKKVVEQLGGILEKGIEKDLVAYSFLFLKKGLELWQNPENFKEGMNNRLGFAVVLRLSDRDLFEDCVFVLGKIRNFEGMENVFKELFSFLPPYLDHHQQPVKHLFSDIITHQSTCGWDFLENLINKNFIPTLVKFLTGSDLKIKLDMIIIINNFFYQQLQHQIIELLENNIVSILCRIIERDQGETRISSLRAMDTLLQCNNEIFKSFADSCRFSRLLGQVGKEEALNQTCVRILTQFYPRVPLPVAVLLNPPVKQVAGGNNIPVAVNQVAPSAVINQVAPNFTQQIANNPKPATFINPPANQMNFANSSNNIVLKTPVQPVSDRKKKGVSNQKDKKQPKNHPQAKKQSTSGKSVNLIQTKIAFSGKASRTRVSAQAKSGLLLPAGRIHRKMRESRLRVSRNAAVYMAGMLEYLCAEVLCVAGDRVKQDKRKIISPKDIQQAVRNDTELDVVMTQVVFPESGNCQQLI